MLATNLCRPTTKWNSSETRAQSFSWIHIISIHTYNNALMIPECFRTSRMFDIDLSVIDIEISSLKFPQEPLSLYNMYTILIYIIYIIIYCSLIKLNYSTILIRLFSSSSFVSITMFSSSDFYHFYIRFPPSFTSSLHTSTISL